MRCERRRGAGCSANRDHAHPALAGRPDEPELPLPARRLGVVPGRRPDPQPRRVREVPQRVAGGGGQITEIANNWTRLFASSAQLCNAYTVCEHVIRPSKKEWRWAAEHLTAAVQGIAISGDRAAVMLTNHNALYLRRTATGEWLIDEFGVGGLLAELRRKLLGPGA